MQIGDMQNIDFQIFHFINSDLSNSFFDWFAPILREKKTWIPLYIIMFTWLVYRYGKNSILFILIAIATVGISDYSASSIIKPLVKRLRPCNDVSADFFVIERINCSSGFSFPSSHASNHFALASFFALTVFRKNLAIKLVGFIWATLIAMSQVYVGVHYPIDIFGGACLGMLVAMITFTLSVKLWPEYITSIQR